MTQITKDMAKMMEAKLAAARKALAGECRVLASQANQTAVELGCATTHEGCDVHELSRLPTQCDAMALACRKLYCDLSTYRSLLDE